LRVDRVRLAAVVLVGEDRVHPRALEQVEGQVGLLRQRLDRDLPGPGQETIVRVGHCGIVPPAAVTVNQARRNTVSRLRIVASPTASAVSPWRAAILST